MGSLATAESSAKDWIEVSSLGFTNVPANYEPTIAIAQNHVHFMGIEAGSADIFVIHCALTIYHLSITYSSFRPVSYFQPEVQSYGSDFPATHGQAPSFFKAEGVQQEFAYIPDGGSNVYVINVEVS